MGHSHVGHGRQVTEDRESYAPEPASLLAISRVLEETARMLHDWALADDPPLRRPADPPLPITARTVRSNIAARWLRREFLGVELGDTEWSLMLELYAARLEGRQVHQTGLSVAAGVPQSTALQATRRLVEAGIFATTPDPSDGRKLLVALTAPAAERIRSYLTAALEIGSPVV
jgi:DNA-binding MarR family transcriptional regulator